MSLRYDHHCLHRADAHVGAATGGSPPRLCHDTATLSRGFFPINFRSLLLQDISHLVMIEEVEDQAKEESALSVLRRQVSRELALMSPLLRLSGGKQGPRPEQRPGHVPPRSPARHRAHLR